MLNWRSEWATIRDRIAGHQAALGLFVAGQRVLDSDAYAMKRKVFGPATRSILASLSSFRERHGAGLPVGASQAIERFATEFGGLLANKDLDNFEHTLACATVLAGLRAELDMQLADSSVAQLRITERAIEHLQRSIVVDAGLRQCWQSAFDSGEVACEQLGAVHLLHHGIWAFKVSATGERTDLVYGEPMRSAELAARSADALVLTEWKLVRTKADIDGKLVLARQQLNRYAQGVLGGVELGDSRFVIVVSDDHVALPPDEQAGASVVRYRNVAVRPSPPSHLVR